jgi:hypothetical protein
MFYAKAALGFAPAQPLLFQKNNVCIVYLSRLTPKYSTVTKKGDHRQEITQNRRIYIFIVKLCLEGG